MSAPTQQTFALLDPVLKDIYGPKVVDQLNNEILAFQLFNVTDENIFGRQVILGLHTARSGGAGARDEGDDLPAPSAQGYQKAIYDLKYLYGRGQVTGVAMIRTRSQLGSMVNALRDEMTRIRDDLLLDVARQTYGDGTAKLGTLAVNTGVTTLTLQSDEPLRKGFVYVNQVVDIGSGSNPRSIATARAITDVNVANKTITISGANVTTAAGDYFSVANSIRDDGTSKEMTGLLQLINPTANVAVGNIDPTTAGNGFWDNLRDSSGSLTLDNMRKWTNQMRVSGGQVSVMLGSFGIQRSVYNLLQSQIQLTGEQVTNLPGGFKSLSFDGYPLLADRLFPFGKLLMADKRHLKMYAANDWHFIDDDGHVLVRVSGKDAFEFSLRRFSNFGIDRRNVHFLATGISDTTGY